MRAPACYSRGHQGRTRSAQAMSSRAGRTSRKQCILSVGKPGSGMEIAPSGMETCPVRTDRAPLDKTSGCHEGSLSSCATSRFRSNRTSSETCNFDTSFVRISFAQSSTKAPFIVSCFIRKLTYRPSTTMIYPSSAKMNFQTCVHER